MVTIMETSSADYSGYHDSSLDLVLIDSLAPTISEAMSVIRKNKEHSIVRRGKTTIRKNWYVEVFHETI